MSKCSKVCDLVSLATCLLFALVLRDPGPSAEVNLPYLGMACGFFAKLASMKQAPFTAAACILRIAQQVMDRERPFGKLEQPSFEEHSRS